MNSEQNQHNDMINVIATLREIAAAVMHASEGETVEQVLKQIANVARDLVKARYAALGIPDGKGGMRYFMTSGVSDDIARAIGHNPYGHGLLGVIMHEQEPLRLLHMKDDPRSVGFPKHHPSMDSLLGVPVRVGQRLYGMLYMCDRIDGNPFNEDDQWLVEMLAAHAAMAITTTQVAEQQKRLVLLEERERIGMELHDGIIQSLYAIGMHMELMRTTGQVSYEAMGDSINNLDQVIEDIRGYILNLQNAAYQQKTIYECLRDIISRLHTPPSLSIEIDAVDRQPPFSPPVFEAVCQILQEGISNVIRHANASHLEIKVTEDSGYFEVRLIDNGKGFDRSSLQEHTGLGLNNIQQRARLHGGTVAFDSRLGHGTQMIVRMPVKIS